MFKVVVSDLDGTLLTQEHQIGEYTRSVLKAITLQGVTFGIATGRPWGDVVGISKVLDHEFFLITSNGARVHDHQGNCLFSQDIPEHIVSELINLDPPDGAFLNIYRGTSWLVTEAKPELLGAYAASGFSYTLVQKNEIAFDSISKLFWIGDHEALCKFKEQLIERFGDEITVTFSAPRYLEVMAAGVSKASALSHVLAERGFDASHVLAFGDADNDHDMLASASRGLLMENASYSLKQSLPHLEAIGHHRDEAVARYLESIYL